MSGKITRKQVNHIAKLANIQLTKSEIKKYQQQLSKVLDYVEQLNEVDTVDVKPTAQVTGSVNRMRSDEQKENLSAKEALDQAPATYLNYFLIKAILEK
jgi:aspartyl-tRNA(Asn)/glutamyl-tRNA(Gln) amidotransferase subunit C